MNGVCDTLTYCAICIRGGIHRRTLLETKGIAERERASFDICPKGYTHDRLPSKEAKAFAKKMIHYKNRNYPCCDKRRQMVDSDRTA